MYYHNFKPSAQLASFVECYFVWENQDTATTPLRVESPPSGYASMVFNYGDAYRVSSAKYASMLVPTIFLTGQATQNYTLDLAGRIGMVGVVFKPAGLSSLFGLPMYEFTDERINLTDVLGTSMTDLHEQVLEARSGHARVQVLERFLLRQLLKKRPSFDRTDYAANLIVTQKGVVNVSELMDDLYVCRRQFERQFLHKVGLGYVLA